MKGGLQLDPQYSFYIQKQGEPRCTLGYEGPISDLPIILEKARLIGLELMADINVWYKPIENTIKVCYYEKPEDNSNGVKMQVIPQQILPTIAERKMIPQFLHDTRKDYYTDPAYEDVTNMISNVQSAEIKMFEFDGKTMWIPAIQAPLGKIGIDVKQFQEYLIRVGFYKNRQYAMVIKPKSNQREI